jgi:hypothetical protein
LPWSGSVEYSSLPVACFGLGDLVGVALDDQLDAGADLRELRELIVQLCGDLLGEGGRRCVARNPDGSEDVPVGVELR